MTTSTTLPQQELQQRLDELIAGSSVPGYVAGIWWDGAEFELASGVANLNTGAPMTTDSSFLLGSITKIMMSTILMRFVECGLLNLDDLVVRHLPELQLGDLATQEQLTIRGLVNHTSGIDAADFCPEFGRGDDATRRYVEALAGIGQIYPLGEHISYCNPAFVILGRIFEVLTGDPFDSIIKREIFRSVGMDRTCTSGDEAILHRAAIGHIVDPTSGVARPTRRYMLPYGMAAAGSTVITTIADLLRFARVHLEGGVASEGECILSSDAVSLMATPTIRDEGLFGLSVGLSWLMPDYGATQLLTHGGGSFGGGSTLVVVPEKRFAYAAFANSTTSATVHARMTEIVLQEILGLPAPPTMEPTTEPLDLGRYTGTYEKQYTRYEVAPEGDDALSVRITTTYEDEFQRDLFREYTGQEQLPPFSVRPVTETLFVAPETPKDSISRPAGYGSGLVFLDPDADGRFTYLSSGLRMARRVR